MGRGEGAVEAAEEVDEQQQEAGVADVDVGGEDEEEVAENAGGGEAEEVAGGVEGAELPADVVEGGEADDEDEPKGGEEGAEDAGDVEGAERGVEVVVLPNGGGEDLHGLVEGGGGGGEQAEELGVEAVDVVEVDDGDLLVEDGGEEADGDHEGEDEEEEDQGGLAEDVDGLGDAVVGDEGADEGGLGKPALDFLGVGDFDPEAVGAIGGVDGELGHDDAVATAQGVVAVFEGEAGKDDAVFVELHIGAEGVGALLVVGRAGRVLASDEAEEQEQGEETFHRGLLSDGWLTVIWQRAQSKWRVKRRPSALTRV